MAPDRLTHANWRDRFQPLLLAVESLPRVNLSASEVVEIGHGRPIVRIESLPDSQQFAAVDAAGRLAAILARRGKNQLGPLRNFPRNE